jgi:tetratricopeptide (TPR) repeat protein
MAIKDEEEILKNLDPKFENLSAAEVSSLIQKKAKPEERSLFEKRNREKMRLCMQAEGLIQEGRLNQAIEMLNFVISSGYFGNEYPYGLLGDAYFKKGDKKTALEMYTKSGSIDSLKKAKKIRI